jgi:hypothetical protein
MPLGLFLGSSPVGSGPVFVASRRFLDNFETTCSYRADLDSDSLHPEIEPSAQTQAAAGDDARIGFSVPHMLANMFDGLVDQQAHRGEIGRRARLRIPKSSISKAFLFISKNKRRFTRGERFSVRNRRGHEW